MKNLRIRLLPPLLAAVFLLGFHSELRSDEPPAQHPAGDYLGQTPPGDSALIFAPGIISTGYDELNSVFSPGGDEFYFSVKQPNQDRHVLMVTKRIAGLWTNPEVLPFSGLFGDADPAFAPPGTRIFFISRRPLEIGGDCADWNIWYTDRSGNAWTDPRPLASPVNSNSHEVHPSFAGNGTMYFSSDRPGGWGGFDIYRSRLADGEYAEPENLGEPINTEHGEGDLFVSPDESFIIFSSGRPGGFGRNDLYISFRQADGSWAPPLNMGNAVNSEAIEYCPFVTKDGKFLFFSSYRKVQDVAQARIDTYKDLAGIYSSPGNGLGDIYWIDAKIIAGLRPSGALQNR